MKPVVRIQLSVMMFLEFFIWGAWFVTMGAYLNKIGFSGAAIGNAYSTTAIAAILSPFFVGLIADRFFSAEKVLGLTHLLGAAALYGASYLTTPATFFWVVLLYTLCYMPTLALTNAVAFHQMKDPGREFPAIRVLGTLGWIVAGLLVGWLALEETAMPMRIAAGTSVAMGLFCFTLPNTPPRARGQRVRVADLLGLDAIKLMRDRSFAVFIVASLLICIPLAFYYSFANLFLNETGLQNAAGKMTLGQASEVFFMLVMPFFFARLGVKKMLLVGMLAWTARYVCFGFGNTGALVPLLFVGILLHGICYDFFFVTGQIYTDNKAPLDLRAAAQGFITLVTQGIGMLIGNQIAGRVADRFATPEALIKHDWRAVWLIPAVMALVVAVLFALFFREKDAAGAVPATEEAAAPVKTEVAS